MRIKFLHAADLHLDSPFAALPPEQAARRRREQRELLGQIVELCNGEQCDLLLLAGDLFDGATVYPDTLEVLQRHDVRQGERTADARQQGGTPGGQPGTTPETAHPGQASA